MQVRLSLTFTADDIKALILKRCAEIECPCEGHFEIASYAYIRDVEVKFFTKGKDDGEEVGRYVEQPEPIAVAPVPAVGGEDAPW